MGSSSYVLVGLGVGLLEVLYDFGCLDVLDLEQRGLELLHLLDTVLLVLQEEVLVGGNCTVG